MGGCRGSKGDFFFLEPSCQGEDGEGEYRPWAISQNAFEGKGEKLGLTRTVHAEDPVPGLLAIPTCSDM